MSELSEQIWKHRFSARLAVLFKSQGISENAAFEDAYAHANDHYRDRSNASPEKEAESVYASLFRDMRN
jgi:hypothetical protein